MDHALECQKGGLISIGHNNIADEWGALCASTLTPSSVADEPLINYGGRRTVTGEIVSEPEEEDTERHKEEVGQGG